MADVVKTLLLIALGLAGCNSCQPPVATTPLSDQSVYGILVDGGCMAPDPDGGVAAVAKDHASPNPAWLNCLYGGGSITGCQVPCTK